MQNVEGLHEEEIGDSALFGSLEMYTRGSRSSPGNSRIRRVRGTREEGDTYLYKRAMRVALASSCTATVYIRTVSMLDGNTATPGPRVSIYAVQHFRNARRHPHIPVCRGGCRYRWWIEALGEETLCSREESAL